MPDPYLNPDALPESTLTAMSTRLEERGQHAGFLKMMDRYLSTLPTDRPLRVLDLGTGTGVVLRRLAEKLHPDSELHGADISNNLLDEARRLSPEQHIHWDHLQPGTLPYDDASFDVILMHTLLGHVPEPAELLRDVRRICSEQGQLIIFDADHAGTTYSLPDYQESRRIDALLVSAIATQPDICRQLPRLLQASGFELQSHDAELLSECGKGNYWLSSVRGFAKLIPALGILPPEEGERWEQQMLTSHEEGSFFASGAFYTFYARPRRGEV